MSSSNRAHRGAGALPSSATSASAETGEVSSARDHVMLEQVYRTEAPRLARYFRSRLPSSDDASDLVQEAFLRFARLARRGALVQPAAYLQRIARNLLYDRAKRSESRLARFHVPIGEGAEPQVRPQQADRIEAEDVMRLYRQALEELPPKTAEVFILHRVEDLTYREIGLRLGIAVPTVQYHFARALAHIDAALDRG